MQHLHTAILASLFLSADSFSSHPPLLGVQSHPLSTHCARSSGPDAHGGCIGEYGECLNRQDQGHNITCIGTADDVLGGSTRLGSSPFNWCRRPFTDDCRPIPAEVARGALVPTAQAAIAYSMGSGKTTGNGCLDGPVQTVESDTVVHAYVHGKGRDGAEGGASYAFLGTYDGSLYLSWAGTNFDNEEDRAEDCLSRCSWSNCGCGLTSVDLGGADNYTVLKGMFEQYHFMMHETKQTDPLNVKLAEMLAEPGSEITVVGHSLGGAKAQFAAVEIANRFKARVRLVTLESLSAFGTTSARRIWDELIVGHEPGMPDNRFDNRFGADAPPAGQIAAQRWVRMGDYAPGYLGKLFDHGMVEHISRGMLISKSAVPSSMNTLSEACFGCYEYTQKSRTYTPYNVAISTLHYHSITGVLLGLNGGSCNWRAP